MRSPGSRLWPITASGPTRATLTCPSGSSTSVKYTSHEIWPWMLVGWTFFRMPSRVPLSTLSPTQNPLERVEERPRVLELREQACAILVDEPIVYGLGQPPLVGRQHGPLDPLDDLVACRQDMRIDDQAHLRLGEPAAIHDAGVQIRRQDGVRSRPAGENGSEWLSCRQL